MAVIRSKYSVVNPLQLRRVVTRGSDAERLVGDSHDDLCLRLAGWLGRDPSAAGDAVA
jgi:hypothetical protein